MFLCQLILLLVFQLHVIATWNAKEANDNVQMQVRAVFINCDESDSTFPESKSTRFAQEELFRYGSLTNCNKKLALTVKLAGETDGNFGDEYIPIEHVINGPGKRRTRLLNPYVLRLRREPSLQAYELRRIDTVNGILTNTDYEEDGNLNIKRHINELEHRKLNWYQNDNINNVQNKDSDIIHQLKQNENYITDSEKELTNVTFENRFKRHEYSHKAQNIFDDGSQLWTATDNLISEIQQPVYDSGYKKYRTPEDDSYSYPKINKQQRMIPSNYRKSDLDTFAPKSLLLDNKLKTERNVKYDNFTTVHSELKSSQAEAIDNIDNIEKAYALYEIGNPDMWSTVQVQLFEKLSASSGGTVWNDITKGESASVSSLIPDWGNEHMKVRYQNPEWVAPEDFTFATSGVYLLTSTRNLEADHLVDNMSFVNGQKYFVLPADAIITLNKDPNNLIKRSNTDSDPSSSTENKSNEQFRRRVQIRWSRALFSTNNKKMNIAARGKDQFLTIPYGRACRGQIDLEAKADENQLVTVGSSGRITTAVSDSTRPTSTVLTIQSTNTGLAAARFRALVRECHPAIHSEFDNDSKGIVTDRILIPPKQTRMLKLQVPSEIPVDFSHCSVALLNDFDEELAVRDVTIRKGDRCFCVWHCDCVCLSEDPKLLCREMPVSRQIAAGLSSYSLRRHARSVCYHDIVSIDMCVIIIGVITALLLLGLLKALIGLFFVSVRNWGLDHILQTPRKLDHYYEKSLSSRPVEYDTEGWPVHPDTKKRTVLLVSRPMVFILNIIYFIVTPCLILRNIIATMLSCCKGPRKSETGQPCSKETKKCFSSHDMQSVEPRWQQRRGDLRRWMTPQAEELSADLWRKAIPSQQPVKCELMQPLLHKHNYHNGKNVIEGQDSCMDSEQDDTEYVLVQMQKSKESLRRNQRIYGPKDFSKNYAKGNN